MSRHYSDIQFTLTENRYSHNLDADYSCFALWKSARPFRDRIRKLLSEHFEILLESEIEWSSENFNLNAARLYEEAVFKGIELNKIRSVHRDKIDDRKFILFVIKDKNPEYTYAQSVSGKIELSNLNVVSVKEEIRKWIKEETGEEFGVHSTNSILEFFFQATLLLGEERVDKILNGERISEEKIAEDLIGSDGWKDYRQMFSVMNRACNYLILRGFEALPKSNPEKDLDLLTDNYQRLASVLGARQLPDRPYKAVVKVGGEEISLDMRFVGDKYYDAAWENNMLQNKIFKTGIFVPAEDDYFFSLLYHAKVQKTEVKPVYIDILTRIAENLGFSWFDAEVLKDNEKTGKILAGYMKNHTYYYEDPLDEGVVKHMDVINFLPGKDDFMVRKSGVHQLKTKIFESLPEPVAKKYMDLKKKLRNKS